MALSTSTTLRLPMYPTAKIFVSSAQSEEVHRERARIAINDLVGPMLMQLRLGLRLEAVLWEDFAAQIVQHKEVNDVFIDQVADSHLVIVLIGETLRPGTAGELKKALATDTIDIALIKLTKTTPAELTAFLEDDSSVRSERLLYKEANPDESWVEILRPILRFCLQWLIRDTGETVYADRI